MQVKYWQFSSHPVTVWTSVRTRADTQRKAEQKYGLCPSIWVLGLLISGLLVMWKITIYVCIIYFFTFPLRAFESIPSLYQSLLFLC